VKKKKVSRPKKGRRKTKDKRELNRKLIAVLWFLVKFNFLAIPLYLVIFMNISIPALQSSVANIVQAVLNALDYNSVVDGYIINLSSGLSVVSVEINFDCIGWKSMYALFALVIATPKVFWKNKLKFLAISMPAIFVINILRIVTTIAIAMSFGLEYLEAVHNILWQEGLIVVVLGVWYFWLRKVAVIKTLKNEN